MVDETGADELSVVERIYDALEDGYPGDALRIARGGLAAMDELFGYLVQLSQGRKAEGSQRGDVIDVINSFEIDGLSPVAPSV